MMKVRTSAETPALHADWNTTRGTGRCKYCCSFGCRCCWTPWVGSWWPTTAMLFLEK